MRIPAGIFLPLALIFCVASASGKPPTLAARKSPAKPVNTAVLVQDNSLDTVRVHQAYLDGDFDLAIDMLEAARKHGDPFSHADSVFLFKHLGVMYAAQVETRELGKQNMMNLLRTEPSARIMDMYASDMIYMIFKNIQEEYAIHRAKLDRAQGHVQGNQEVASAEDGTQTTKGAKTREKKSRSHAWLGWTAGALAVAGGAALYYYLEDDSKSEQKVNNVP
ncbi:MAG TPA: hypothetical protein VK465_03840 [Fibrobacteria bacterium]|nr:hypothetical protein [Fibrobacteria bacterium]